MIPAASFRALGTTAVVAVTASAELDQARALLQEELEVTDRCCSRFREDSELAHLNRHSGNFVEVSADLCRFVRVALEAAQSTRGLVDPTLGAQLRAIGYDRTFELVSARDGWQIAATPRPRAAWQDVVLDESHGRVRVPADVELDLGATAKAEAADRAATEIAASIGGGVLVALGGDVAVAGPPPAEGWCALIADSHEVSLDAAGPRIVIRSGGLATSSAVVRSWRTDRGVMHHVLDPRTGSSAPVVWRTVTVADTSCVAANVASTAAIVLGAAAPAWLARRGTHARLVAVDGGVRTTGAWPNEQAAA